MIKNSYFCKCKIASKDVMMHNLKLYDLLSEVGVGVRILRKKRFVDAWSFTFRT